MGTTLEGILALGAEYEYMDYSSAKLKYEDGYEMEDQTQYISEDLKGVHTLRLGMEARVAPAFSVRAGYNYQTAIFKDAAYKALIVTIRVRIRNIITPRHLIRLRLV